MNKYVSGLDLIKFEFFEHLFPTFIYTEENLDSILKEVVGNDTFIRDLIDELCMDDGIECTYTKDDFVSVKLEAGGFHFIQIDMPTINKYFNDFRKVYIIYIQNPKNNKIIDLGYFAIKYFTQEDKYYLVYVNKEYEMRICEEISENVPLKYELWNIARIFECLIDEDKLEDI